MSKRIAVIAPRGRDAAVVTSILRAAGLDVADTSLELLMPSLAVNDFGAAVMTQEALSGVPLAEVRSAVGRQPAWSDFPFVLLTTPSHDDGLGRLSDALGNVMLVERPIHPATLVNCAQAALRARQRQHEMRSMLEQQTQAEREMVDLAQSLERRVSERTDELQRTNARLEREMRDKEEAEARLRQTLTALAHMSRLSAANTMASTIAHELNQPLTAAVNYLRGAERLLRQGDVPEPAIEAVSAAGRNAHRAGDIIRRLRDLVSDAPLRRQPEPLREMIEESRRLLLFSNTAEAVDCIVNVDDDADMVLVDRIQIEQVLVNVIRNATEAMSGLEQPRIFIDAVRERDQVRVRVRDTGPGFPIAPTDPNRLGFASSKPNGLGIGLSICRTIIEANGGGLTTANWSDGGAVVDFTLPMPD